VDIERLELDYLRLRYAILKLGKNKARGYLFITGKYPRQLMLKWAIRYDVDGLITIVRPRFTSDELSIMKAKCKRGLCPNQLKQSIIKAIQRDHPTSKPYFKKGYFPFNIPWDHTAKVIKNVRSDSHSSLSSIHIEKVLARRTIGSNVEG
jgi:hypothetical protein